MLLAPMVPLAQRNAVNNFSKGELRMGKKSLIVSTIVFSGALVLGNPTAWSQSPSGSGPSDKPGSASSDKPGSSISKDKAGSASTSESSRSASDPDTKEKKEKSKSPSGSSASSSPTEKSSSN